MGKHSNTGCPPVESRPPYDELSHQLGKSTLSVKVSKNAGRLKNSDGSSVDRLDNSKTVSAKVNVIQNVPPPRKRPEEEQFVVRTTRHILNSEEMRNTLEIEMKLPRNYEPLPPPPPFKILYPDVTKEDTKDENMKDEHDNKK